MKNFASIAFRNTSAETCRRKFRKSAAVALVLSGTVLGGCQRQQEDRGWTSSEPITNNTYRSSYGYYHAPYGAWFPFPYNYHDPARGYFHGGKFTPQPDNSSITASRPSQTTTGGGSRYVSRGGFGSRGSGIS